MKNAVDYKYKITIFLKYKFTCFGLFLANQGRVSPWASAKALNLPKENKAAPVEFAMNANNP
jgi:hypothetical protein